MAEDAIKMKRVVQVYQRIEESHEVRDGEDTRTEYTHRKKWTETIVDQDTFHKQFDGPRNPKTWPFEKDTFYNNRVNLGNFVLSRDHIDRMVDWKTVNLNFIKDDIIEQTAEMLQSNNYQEFFQMNEWMYSRSNGSGDEESEF